jgi:hypothetical protein
MSALLLKKDRTGEALYAGRSYRAGEAIVEFDQVSWRPMRDRFTVEHPFGGHLFHPVLAKTGHSCEPNAQVSFQDRALVAARPIASGEPVTFDYHTTERRLSHPFDCLCGSRQCRGRIE